MFIEQFCCERRNQMNLTEKTYNQLRDDIFNAKYSPNELITERQIAEKYKVSKLTAGEALHRLCSDGHLTSYPRSGYMVTTLTPTEVGQVKRIRFAMESLVLESICSSAQDSDIEDMREQVTAQSESGETNTETNTRFHMQLAELSGDKFLIKMMRELLGTLSRVEQHIPAITQEKWQDEHVAIMDALHERDAERAIEHLRRDVDQVRY